MPTNDGDDLPGVEPTWLDLALTQAAQDALYERYRQSCVLGWTFQHDDQHSPEELAAAASCYALHGSDFPNRGEPPPMWPWEAEAWKPKSPRENFKRATALMLAAQERAYRAEDARAAQPSA